MTTAIHYSYVRTPSESGKIFGLQIAVLNWLRAYLSFSQQEKFFFLVQDRVSRDEILAVAGEAGIETNRIVTLDSRYPEDNLPQFSNVFRADSDSCQLFWQRNLSNALRFSFCGLSHALAGLEGGKVLEQYCLAPSTAADAIVCPSRAIAGAIRSFWDIYADYVGRRFGGAFRCEAGLPIIPLGIDSDTIEQRAAPDKRKSQRAALGLMEDDIAVLWVGRLSHAIKAHPLSMFRAVEAAARQTGRRVRLLMLGYFMPTEAGAQFHALAKDICTQAEVIFIASDDPRFPDGLWAAGDIFLSLVDNMQESFGLTPIEAIAAGLPRVISDWDGYRDSVRHGEDGFLIPTRQPPPGAGQALSAHLLSGREIYGGFLAKTAQSVVVDHHEAAKALAALINDPALRRRLAENAKKRLPAYHWRTIIPAYEALWAEQAARYAALPPEKPWPAVPPQAPDPFAVYANYPTRALSASDRIQITATTDEIEMLWRHEINVLAFDMMLGQEDIVKILRWIGAQPTADIGLLLGHFSHCETARIWRTLGWLAKLGIVRIDG